MQRLQSLSQFIVKSPLLARNPYAKLNHKLQLNIFNSAKQAKNTQNISRSKFRYLYIPIIGLGVTQWVQSVIKNQEKLRSLEFHMNDNKNEQIIQSHQLLIDSEQNIQEEKKQTIMTRILNKLSTVGRLFTLIFYFTPSLLLFPFYLLLDNDKIQDYFYESLTRGIERAGSLMIKLAQYGSHRGDLMPEKLSKKCDYLRDQVPPHDLKHTEQILQKNGLMKNIVEINKVPIASGCVGQVYKAKYKVIDEKTQEEKIIDVAIKVRHPKILQQLKQDLKLVFSISQSLSKLPYCKHLQVPVTIKEFNHILINQTDFRIEANNQKIFQNNFYKFNYMVEFPEIYYSNEDIIVQDFMQNSRSIHDYVQGDKQVNKRIAKIGTNIFLKMLMFDNFVHADCHAGNLFVQDNSHLKNIQNSQQNSIENKNTGYLQSITDFYNKTQNYIFELSKVIECQWLQTFVDIQDKETRGKYKDLSFLQESYKKQIQEISKVSFSNDDLAQQYKLMLIDSGMVTKLSEHDYKHIIRLLKSLICRDSYESAMNIKKMSSCKDQGDYDRFQGDVENLFSKISQIPLCQINLGQVIKELVDSAKQRQIQVNGNVALLLGNIVILEGLAKQLDPELNIIAEAIPFLLNKKVAQSFID